MAALFGCWKEETSTPFSVVLAAAAVACCMVVDMCTVDPGRDLPVPASGPESSWSSRGECPSAGLGAGAEDDAASEAEGRVA